MVRVVSGRKTAITLRSSRHLSLDFQAFERLYDVTLCCLCEPSAGQDGLIFNLTHPCENTNWQRSSLRERQRGRYLRSNSIIEIESHLNIEILRAITFHLHLMFPPSPLVSFLAFTSLLLRGELTDTVVQAGARRSTYCQKGGGRRMSSWKNGNETEKKG